MRRALAVIIILIGVFGLAQAAHADDGSTPGYIVPPFTCGPTQAPSQVPCDQIPTVPTTMPAFRYCLGYPQQFPYDQPCPQAPPAVCDLHPEEFACHDPSRPPAVERVPGGTVPPTTTAPEVAVEAPVDVEVSSTVVVHQTQHRAVQRRSQPSTLPTTGGSTTGALVAIVLLGAGGGLILATRRRHAVL